MDIGATITLPHRSKLQSHKYCYGGLDLAVREDSKVLFLLCLNKPIFEVPNVKNVKVL